MIEPDDREQVWHLAHKRLRVLARRLALGRPDVLDGDSPEDLVSETFCAFFLSPTGLGWDGQHDVGRFLCGVLKNRFLDRLKRHRKIAGSFDDERFKRNTLVGQTSPAIDDELATKQLTERITTALDDDSLIQLVLAALAVEDGHNVNQRLASELGISVQEVVNRRKRLRRHLSKITLVQDIYGRQLGQTRQERNSGQSSCRSPQDADR